MPFGLDMPHSREVLAGAGSLGEVCEALRRNVLTIETWGSNVRGEFTAEAQRDPDCFGWNQKLKRLQDSRATLT